MLQEIRSYLEKRLKEYESCKKGMPVKVNIQGKYSPSEENEYIITGSIKLLE